MSRRTLAGLLAVPLVIGLWAVAVFQPLPFVTYRPGITVDLLADAGDHPVVQVEGHASYRDDGELRFTTIYVDQPQEKVSLVQLMKAWISDTDAIYPRSVIYPEDVSNAEDRAQSQLEMVNSQDHAIAAALRQMGYQLEANVQVSTVSKGTPADGTLEPRDVLVSVDGTPITGNGEQLRRALKKAGPGTEVSLEILREGKKRTVRIAPREIEGEARIGVGLGAGYTFPFEVSLDIDSNIGGPSAGLMFSLAIYDTLTPGSLTDSRTVAGSGTIDGEGKVGPIGGVQQKIAAAERDGAELFFVAPDNCDEAKGADRDDMRLVRADTMSSAVASLQTWVDDRDAELPACT